MGLKIRGPEVKENIHVIGDLNCTDQVIIEQKEQYTVKLTCDHTRATRNCKGFSRKLAGP